MSGRYENGVWVGSDCPECRGRRFNLQYVDPPESQESGHRTGCELWGKEVPCSLCNQDGSVPLDEKVGNFEHPVVLGNFRVVQPEMIDKGEVTLKAIKMPFSRIWETKIKKSETVLKPWTKMTGDPK